MQRQDLEQATVSYAGDQECSRPSRVAEQIMSPGCVRSTGRPLHGGGEACQVTKR
jgi:hypothetical protein